MKSLSNLNFKFQKNTTSDKILVPQMISAEKVIIPKLNNSSRSTTFVSVISSYESGSDIVHKCDTSLIRFYKLYETCVRLVNNVC